MESILVAGAGKSSIYLIEYLLKKAEENNWQIIVADSSAALIAEKIGNHPCAKSVVLDITNDFDRKALVKEATLVVSLMPPHLHIELAKDCLEFEKHFITASYISEDMKLLDAPAREKGLMFMCEMGLDPGIDHMTATELIDRIAAKGERLLSFKSYCGGLVAPESDDNPWHYKFSWNPRNVVVAGKAGAEYLRDGKEVEIRYEEIFQDNETIEVEGVGTLSWLPNRDSLAYLDTYHVPDVQTFLRATLRYPAFCKGWAAVVALNLTDEEDHITAQTYAGWVRQKLNIGIEESIIGALQLRKDIDCNSQLLAQLSWLGLFSEGKLPENAETSANILLSLLLEKWAMKPLDKDMVVMQHEIISEKDEKSTKLCSTLVVKGENSNHTAMAKTVGLPMGILAELILTGNVAPQLGVRIPNMKEVYTPVLKGLIKEGVEFRESEEMNACSNGL